jgi:hypothetical protein
MGELINTQSNVFAALSTYIQQHTRAFCISFELNRTEIEIPCLFIEIA